MKHIQGSTPKENILSIDGILGGILNKIQLFHDKSGKRVLTPFHVSGYAETCVSGQVICACLSLFQVNVKKAVIVIDEYPKDTELFALIKIKSDTITYNGEEDVVKVPLKQGVNSFDDTRKIKQGDRVSISIVYPDQSPVGIWVAMRGEQL